MFGAEMPVRGWVCVCVSVTLCGRCVYVYVCVCDRVCDCGRCVYICVCVTV